MKLSRDDLFYLREQGCTYAELASYCEVSVRHILELMQSNVGSVYRHTKMTEADFIAWMDGRHGYATWSLVASRMKCSRATAYRYLSDYRRIRQDQRTREAA